MSSVALSKCNFCPLKIVCVNWHYKLKKGPFHQTKNRCETHVVFLYNLSKQQPLPLHLPCRELVEFKSEMTFQVLNCWWFHIYLSSQKRKWSGVSINQSHPCIISPLRILSILSLSLSPAGCLLSNQPSCWYFLGGACGEGFTEWHHPLCWAIYQVIRHQQGLPPLLFPSHFKSSIRSFHFFGPFYFMLMLCSLVVCCRVSTDCSEGAQSCQADVPTLGPVQDAVCLGRQVRHK